MKFNVIFNGKRTTASVPDALWECFIVAHDGDTQEALLSVKAFTHHWDGQSSLSSPGSLLQSSMSGFIKAELRAAHSSSFQLTCSSA
jgi:hypothetical protein